MATLEFLAALNGPATAQLANLQERLRRAEQRLTEIREEEYGLRAELVDDDEVAEALRDFASLWESFSPREQARALKLLIERIDYDGADSTVSLTFRPAGITEIKPVSPDQAGITGIQLLVDQMTEGDAA